MHSAKVLHRDIKPGNILLNADCELKLCDFGLSRSLANIEPQILTRYVVTRWYRAPEVLCSCKDYDEKIDVWAIGCILGELHGREPLFPGDDYLQQLELIFSILGSPTEDDLKFVNNPKAVSWIQKSRRYVKVPFSKLFKEINRLAVDFMEKTIVFDPRKRLSVSEALSHPYLASLRDRSLERDCPVPFAFELDNEKNISKEKLRSLMWEEIRYFHPHLPRWGWWERGESGDVLASEFDSISSSSSYSSSSSSAASASRRR